jgi:hypothetical protein
MTPADHITGRQARRRAAWYRFRVWFRLAAVRVLIPGWIVGVCTSLAAAATGVVALSYGLVRGHVLLASLFLALWRWWQAERTAAIARQLYLDTRQGPLGKEGSTR